MRLPRTSALAGLAGLVVLAAAAPTAAASPAGTIRGADAATAVPDSYIVVFRDDPARRTSVDVAARGLVGRHGGTLGRTWSAALHGFEMRASAKVASRIAADPSVAYVEQNRRVFSAPMPSGAESVRVAGTQSNPPSWGLDRIDQPGLPLDNAYTYPDTAGVVRAYVIDTGIRITHRDFGGRASSGYDAVDGGAADDCYGHGTHVAGILGGTSYGVAKQVRLVAVRVLDCTGSGTIAQVVAGVDWVTAHAVRPAVANMSLGADGSSALDTAVAGSIASGISYAVAAGNGDFLGTRQNACDYSPARLPDAVTVGATDIGDAAASFSNYGTCVDLLAPGVGITSAWYDGDTASRTISGTSMAAPHVAGAAALLLAANPSWNPPQVRAALVDSATPGVVGNPGADTPNRLLRVVAAGPPPPVDNFSVAVSPPVGSVAPGRSVAATVRTRVTGGSARPVSLSVRGLPAGVTASFRPAVVPAGGSSTLTLRTSTGVRAGSYRIAVIGTAGSIVRTAPWTLLVTGGCTGGNGTDVPIPDAGAAVGSGVVIAGCGRTARATSTVAVNIRHPFRGDLIIDLVAPDGTAYRLKNSDLRDAGRNVSTTYRVNLAHENANGSWRLRVRDGYAKDTGLLNNWLLSL
jgi:subtilisin family serine protease